MSHISREKKTQHIFMAWSVKSEINKKDSNEKKNTN